MVFRIIPGMPFGFPSEQVFSFVEIPTDADDNVVFSQDKGSTIVKRHLRVLGPMKCTDLTISSGSQSGSERSKHGGPNAPRLHPPRVEI